MAVLEVPPANDFEEVRSVTRLVGRAVGESARAERLLEKMDEILRDLAASRPTHTLRVASWDGSGAVPGENSLFAELVRAAGGTNAAPTGRGGAALFGMEWLLLAHPDVLAYGAADREEPSLRADTDQHPLLLKLYGQRRIAYPEVLFSCGVPESAEAARELRALLTRVMPKPTSP
jgi:iron complex transport system substrate-binding protein